MLTPLTYYCRLAFLPYLFFSLQHILASKSNISCRKKVFGSINLSSKFFFGVIFMIAIHIFQCELPIDYLLQNTINLLVYLLLLERGNNRDNNINLP